MARILEVDDSRTMRAMIGDAMRQAGHDVDEAADGLAALELVASNDYDIVLTDVHMPRMGGIDLVRELRAIPAYRFKPILLITTETSDQVKQTGREVKATGWITKPFDPDQLVSIVGQLLN